MATLSASADFVHPVTLEAHGVRLEPLSPGHEEALRRAVCDGELWTLRVTSAPEPDQVGAYIAAALGQRGAGDRFPFAVVDVASGQLVGTTSYHEIIPSIRRVEIGYTWYAKSWQRSHVNTTSKLLLLTSQRAIERLGVHKDGVIRHHMLRRDGTVRDTVMYSILAREWPEAKAQLLVRRSRHPAAGVEGGTRGAPEMSPDPSVAAPDEE